MGLDPVARGNIWNLVRNLKKSSTVIMTTHYMDEAGELCDDLIIMVDGSIIACGKPEGIIKKFHAKGLQDVIVQIAKEKDA